MLPLSLDALLQLFKTTSPQKLFDCDCITPGLLYNGYPECADCDVVQRG